MVNRIDDDDDELTHTVGMSALILTNQVLENLLSDISERLSSITDIAKMGLEVDSDSINVRFMLRAIRKISNAPLNTEFLIDPEDLRDD